MLTTRCTLLHARSVMPLQTQAWPQTFESRCLASFLPLLPSSFSLKLSASSDPLRAASFLNPSSLRHQPKPLFQAQSRGSRRLISAEAGASPGATDSQADVKEGNSSAPRPPKQSQPSIPSPAAPVLVFGSDGRLQLSNSKPETALEQPPDTQKASKKTTFGKSRKPAAKAETKLPTKPAPEKEVSWKQGVPTRRDDKPKAKPTGTPKYSKAARRFYNERFRESERLSKVLAAAGVASRRACEDLIFTGRVSVNGSVCTVPQTPVDLVKDNIYVEGRSLPKKLPPKFYFAVNKPKGYVCSSAAESGKTAIGLIEDYMAVWRGRNPGLPAPRLFTVGRLDVATTGLLLITNDGGFAQSVAHPSSGVTKEYIATVGERVTRRQLAALEKGVEVDGVMCIPMLVELVEEGRNSKDGGHKDRLRLIVAEGRNREVRRIVEGAGLSVASLKRVRIGGLRLPKDLALGRYKVLDKSEAQKIASDPLTA